ncbi:hypothetical protein [Christiangramia aquimixticola]|uniref:hypothetical protein n=1 Tax=Christiangramia aquimixticola TaxID=1697558 RepID=UPI003AA7D1A8
MNKALLLVFILILTSCNFETKKISSEEVLEQESRSLNWKEVDEYPAFENCKNKTGLAEAKNCFENQVATTIYTFLANQQPVVTESIHDTIFLYLEITKEGKPQIESMTIDTTITRQLPEIEQWLKQSIDSLPKIYPANKRGIPVSTMFKMPVVVKAE